MRQYRQLHAGDDGLERGSENGGNGASNDDIGNLARDTELNLLFDLRCGKKERIGDLLLFGVKKVREVFHDLFIWMENLCYRWY